MSVEWLAGVAAPAGERGFTVAGRADALYIVNDARVVPAASEAMQLLLWPSLPLTDLQAGAELVRSWRRSRPKPSQTYGNDPRCKSAEHLLRVSGSVFVNNNCGLRWLALKSIRQLTTGPKKL